MNTFQIGNIVKYISGNDRWVKNKYLFRIIKIQRYSITVQSLQDIISYPGYPKGEIIILRNDSLELYKNYKDPRPSWF